MSLALFQQGFRLVAGEALNALVNAINAITGPIANAGPIQATTLTAQTVNTNALAIGGTLTGAYIGYQATGSNSQSGSQLLSVSTPIAVISGCSAASRGVRLTSNAGGIMLLIQNETGTNCLVYPPVGGTINGGSVNASVTLAARKSGLYVESLPGIWYVLQGS
jgi:hypothetical protein